MHVPVLLNEVLEKLDPQKGEFFIDGTIGAAGHAEEILKRLDKEGKFLGIDWDKKAIERLQNGKLKDFENIILTSGNYADIPRILKKNKLPKADGLLIDLGFSSDQLDNSKKGFSFLKNEVLDMRYAPERRMAAAEIVNSFGEKELADIFYKYGEERFSRQIAKKIVEERRKKRIMTTGDLTEIIKKAVPKNYERGRIHPATRVFQALRIYVNGELNNLETVLKNLKKILKGRGRVGIISFHSLEDRIVKNYFKDLEKAGEIKILTKKPVMAGQEEIKKNPRSRSAKLRVAFIK